MALLTPGEPEEQLRAPFEKFIVESARALGLWLKVQPFS